MFNWNITITFSGLNKKWSLFLKINNNKKRGLEVDNLVCFELPSHGVAKSQTLLGN